MNLQHKEARFLKHLLREWRRPHPRQRWAFDWPQLDALGQELGHDRSTTERIVKQLEQVGALKNKAPDWEVLGAGYVLTDLGLQTALRPEAVPSPSFGSPSAERSDGGMMGWLASIARRFGSAGARSPEVGASP
jgi:hypothetical protein